MKRGLMFPKRRVGAFITDWVIWLYISYSVFFLIDHWYTEIVAVRPYYKVPFPWYGWPIVIISSLLIAVAWEGLGTSIGFRAFGLTLIRMDGSPLTLRSRLKRIPLDLISWALSLVVGGLMLVPLVGLGTLFRGLSTGTGISFIPAASLWNIGPWYLSLFYVLLSLVGIVVVGSGCFFVAYWLAKWTWSGPNGEQFWCDRVFHAWVAPNSEIEDRGIPPKRWFATSWGIMTLILIVITFHVGWLTTGIDFGNLIRRAPVTVDLLKRLTALDFTHFITPEPVLRDSIGSAMVETIFMALLATLFGVVFAFPLSFLGARNIMATGPVGWLIYTLTRGFFNVVRSVEPLVWALIFAVWVSFGPFAGVMALAIHTIAALGKLYSEQVESIDPGPLEAIASTGAQRWQVIVYGVIPQIIPSYLAFTMYRWDINVRMSTVIGLVGGGGIGRILFHYKNDLRWGEVGAVIVVIIAVVWAMDYVSGLVREKIA